MSIEDIQKIVSEYYGLTIEQLTSKCNKREIVQARQISIFFCSFLTNEKDCEIERAHNLKYRISNSIKVVKDLNQVDRIVQKEIKNIIKIIIQND